LQITKETIEKCLTLNKVPGTERKECGNYLEHDLEEAKSVLTNI
jgi:S-ribosylhomocysteine lyase LuxS involved in autoinducer biosynthesis